jgi:hypothetical protein
MEDPEWWQNGQDKGFVGGSVTPMALSISTQGRGLDPLDSGRPF